MSTLIYCPNFLLALQSDSRSHRRWHSRDTADGTDDRGWGNIAEAWNGRVVILPQKDWAHG